MTLDFHAVLVDEIGKRANDGLMWSRISIKFHDTKNHHHPEVRVAVPMIKDRSATLHDIEEEARACALLALKEAIALLDGNTVQALSERQEAAEKAEISRLVDRT